MPPIFFRLMERHRRIDEALRAEQTRRWPDWARLAELKVRKLRLKDRMHRVMQRLNRTPSPGR